MNKLRIYDMFMYVYLNEYSLDDLTKIFVKLKSIFNDFTIIELKGPFEVEYNNTMIVGYKIRHTLSELNIDYIEYELELDYVNVVKFEKVNNLIYK